MTVHSRRFSAAATLLVAFGLGCHTNHWNDSCDSCATTESACGVGENGARRWSDEWYAHESQRPDGTRQVEKHGKMWPPYPRPCGEKAEYSHRFHAAHYWPHPFNCQDRAYLQNVSAIQVNNGWTTETTLFMYHFDEKDHSLNHAGREKLKWILHTIPEHRRFVWVQSADDNAVSEARLAGVREAAEELAGGATIPPIMLRVAPVDGRPTKEVNEIRIKEMQTIPAPRLSGSSSTGGGSGGSASGPSF